jgi:uncharacterized protein YuzE
MTDHLNKFDRYAYYDREADIVWLPAGSAGEIYGDEEPWGLITRDRETGAVVAIEIWSASEVLPKFLLDNLPEPGQAHRSGDG